ncbi:hypothetical protein DVH24_005539 [Malus domestica]|uniref:Uncharacterized protein n=1 Tax=Malus domestica TaxID=3750 RepID=A0A498IIW2_MALDO|nr:hypothetical protein DVH24_005539 [Malus domestica]
MDLLRVLPPSSKQDDTFLCKASVRWLDTRYEWWYNVCPNYAKQMHKDPTTGELICQKHPNQSFLVTSLPGVHHRSMILSALGLPFPHGFIFGNSRATSQWVTHPGSALASFSLNFEVPTEPEVSELPKGLVIDRDENIHLRITPLGDELHSPFVKEISMSSTTVSSSTTPPETTTEFHKRKRESIKRPLFIGSEKRLLYQ